MKANQETRQFQLASSISASAAATGYGETDYAYNAFLLLNILATGGGTVTLALSSGTATGAAGSAVVIGSGTATSVTANATGSYMWRIPGKVSKYVYASGSGSAGAPTWVASVVTQGHINSAEGATANRATEG